MSAELEQQIALLSKALEREKKARQQLELKIEAFNAEQFEINKDLLSSYEHARVREVQLQFLTFLSKNNIDDKSLNEITHYFASNIKELFSQASCLIYKRINGQIQELKYQAHGMPDWQAIQLSDDELQELPRAKELNKWQRQEFTASAKQLAHYRGEPTLVINFSIKERYQVGIVLVIEHYCYSDDFKDTLQIAANQFATIISKRLTDAELSLNYQKLKSTVKTLRSTQKQLVHAEKMASLGTLSAGVAHEINNPLSYLASNLETLNTYVDEIETFATHQGVAPFVQQNSKISYVLDDLPDLLFACVDATKRISNIVSGLNSFSRKNDENLSPLDISSPIEAAVAITHNELKYKHQVQLDFNHQGALVSGNKGQLQQVFTNFLINAAHAMPEGGNVSISTLVIEGNLQIKISDQGIGMEEKVLARIFEPFFTTKAENEGTGLGLSITYAILTAHNAVVEVDSTKNKGTTFSIMMPLT